MAYRLDWQQDGRDWPNRETSAFVAVDGQHWHVQKAGVGPVIVLLHGTAATTHSWAGLLPRLATQFTVIAPDYPGHGFSDPPTDEVYSLPSMARRLAALFDTLAISPVLLVGHSAGAAIAARLCLDGLATPKGIVSLNGAMLPLQGVARHLFSPAAKLLAATRFTPSVFAWWMQNPYMIEGMLRDTGSRIPPETLAPYKRLLRSPGHVAAALKMMAQWDLESLSRELPRLAAPILLVSASNDRTVRPFYARAVKRLIPKARQKRLSGLGHLAHEEDPAAIAALVTDFADEVGAMERGASMPVQKTP